MRFIVDKEVLQDNISKVIPAAASTKVTSILECVLIEAEDRIIFTTNDMKMQMQTEFEAEILERGSALLKAKLLSDIVKKLPSGDVEVIREENEVKIRSQKIEFRLPTLEPLDFPKMDRKPSESFCEFVASEFVDAVDKVIFATSKDETRPTFTGVLFEKEDDDFVNLVGMDGHRLAICKIKPVAVEGSFSKIVPAENLDDITKIVDIEEPEKVRVSFFENQATFEIGSTTVILTLISGKFFDYKSAIPTEYSTKISISSDVLESTLERASIVSKDEKTNIQAVIFETNGMMFTVKSVSADGRYEEDVLCSVEGKDIRVGFNVKYFLDVLKELDGEINLFITSQTSPSIVQKPDDPNYIYLVLPIKMPE
ncbi:DNA polymerase-3 subunit beta [Caldicellulosiruptor bescii]|jgi:DNA polymerase-3 subunit beta|uniref:Beta sliding clamp n=2 Tax=Caldicellulosiruptor bescii TaxID=31899 RepID=B9ML38_CALBD|nr:DNA polymerase III subunit beta [Caldicellulosiruptor bescii]ACM59169.1 DNA polymerase III, beta subunit [Caldicellulosiruptor bescii DSM 6725]PBC88378.1 DNA polymerase-3 subunit beta [Caldicellulosiruptor bescii]PBC92141.1 DNA polymerase-3 subunit beta [Caldicellulosiruptor bescii]PBD05049.1 DNA polymerase-3 subunit beta [Caldicellulosiruptor bescii]PBD05320.1 DNA polymerase-3 subunit beta [Caldicellulosiruptor bescii]